MPRQSDPSYCTWIKMRSRCNNPKDENFKYYGGRGIKVCERWNKFPAFLEDMGERPSGMSLDRIDPNGDYEPKNCRWATLSEQNRNKRTVRKFIVNGKELIAREVAEIVGRDRTTIRKALRGGMTVDALYAKFGLSQ